MKVKIDKDWYDDWIVIYLPEFSEKEPVSWLVTSNLLKLEYNDSRDDDLIRNALIDAVEEQLDEIVYNVLDNLDCVETTTNNPYAYLECVYDADEKDMPEIFDKIAHAIPSAIEIKLDTAYEKELEARKVMRAE